METTEALSYEPVYRATINSGSDEQPIRTMSIASALEPARFSSSSSAAPTAPTTQTNQGEMDAKTRQEYDELLKGKTTTIIYQCDCCGENPLRKARYRCDSCKDYDLCERCYAGKKFSHDPSHSFTRFIVDFTIARTNPPSSSSGSAGVPTPNTTGSGEAASSYIRPPRRSASGKPGSSSENAIERLDDLLARANCGPLPASSTSSLIAIQILDLYDAGLAAAERHKKSKFIEQLNARIAMTLAGIPLRQRRGSNFVARPVPDPVEQDLVAAALAAFTAQLIVLDTDKALYHLELNKPDNGEIMDMQRLKNNVESGTYFRKVETPIQAFQLYSKHLVRLFTRAPIHGAPESVCIKFDRMSRTAFDELRDAFGLEAQFVDEEDNGDQTNGNKRLRPALFTTGSSQSLKDGKPDRPSTNGSLPDTSKSAGSSSAPVSYVGFKKTKLKRRRDDEDDEEEEESQSKVQPPSIHNLSQTNAQQPEHPAVMTNSAMPSQMPSSLLPAPSKPVVVTSNAVTTRLVRTADEAKLADLTAEVKRLRDDLEDAHARIDVLIHLLREKVANPLIRGLDRAIR